MAPCIAPFVGVVAYVRLFAGGVRRGQRIRLCRGGRDYEVQDVGWFRLQRLSLLGAQTDLMRLRGIGPDAARVLVAAGCRGLAELQQSDPQALADAVKRTNDRTRLSTNPPRVENLVAWIEQAQELAPLYQPDT